MINRDQELSQLYDKVMGRESFYLHAPGGMGKTTLLKQLITKLEGRRVCIMVTLRALPHEAAFLHSLVSGLKEAQGSNSNVSYQLNRILSENPVPMETGLKSLTQWTENLLVGLQSISQDFLFVFEDLHQWEGKGDVSEFFDHFLRARNSQALLTSDYPLPGFEKMPSLEVLPLTAENLQGSFSSDYFHRIADQLLEYTAGNTAFTLELIGQNALSSEPLEKSIEPLMARYHQLFYGFRQRFTELQWKLLRAIAREGQVSKPHAFEFLMDYRLGAASSVERALRNLADSGMIVKREEGWKVKNVVFQRWLQWLYSRENQKVS